MAGTLAMARGAVVAGVRRLTAVGTCLEYDVSFGHLTESTRLAPSSVYASAKASTWQILDSWLPQVGMSFLWARLFFLYGEGEDPRRLVGYIHRQLKSGRTADLSSGNAVRDYMEVNAAAKLLADEALGKKEGVTNVCSGRGVTVRELAEAVADKYGRRDLLNFGGRAESKESPDVIVGVRSVLKS